MAEFKLPKNSRITKGKTWPKPEGATNIRTFRIYRWNEESGNCPVSTPIMSIWTNAARWFWMR